MKIDGGQIDRISALARLKLTAEEREEFSRQLSDIVSFVEKINELNTDHIDEAGHIVPMKNVFRNDQPSQSLNVGEIERMAPRFEMGHIVVPPVFEEAE